MAIEAPRAPAKTQPPALRQSDRQLVVATANPGDFEAEQAIGFVSSRDTIFEVATPNALNAAMDTRYSPDRAFESLIDTLAAGASLTGRPSSITPELVIIPPPAEAA